MDEGIVSRGFQGRRPPQGAAARLPPGQYVEEGFPVLSAGPTPHTPLARWDFRVLDADGREVRRWSWAEFALLPAVERTCDLHCVTRWSKFDTRWRGVSVDTVLAGVDPGDAAFLTAFCDGGYTTNLPLAEARGDGALVALDYEGAPLAPEHGGPARLLVPRLYLWKSAKWLRGLRLRREDAPGFWERRGYHNHGDPWKEERFWRS